MQAQLCFMNVLSLYSSTFISGVAIGYESRGRGHSPSRVMGSVEIRGENLDGESGDPVGLNVELDNTLCINCNLYYSVQTNFYKQQKSTLHVTEGFIVVYGPVAYPKKDNHARFANFRQDFSKKKLDNAQFSNVRASKFKTACMQISNFVLRQHCAHCVGFRHTSPSLVTNH